MAVKIVQGHTCDDCAEDDLDVPALRSYAISIDGRPFKQLDFCGPSDRAVMSRLIQLYEERGAELPPKPEKKPVKKAAVTRKEPKELERAPEQKPPVSKEKETKKDPDTVWCPLPHGKEGAGKAIAYRHRPGHAVDVHGLEPWEIKWDDPHGILKVPCTAHAECRKTGLAYRNDHGVWLHVQKCRLPVDRPLEEFR